VDPRLALEVLAGLVRARKLGVEDVDVIWRESCERWTINQRWTLLENGLQDGDLAVSHLVSLILVTYADICVILD
jgi:hypothetical protein